MLYKLVTGGDTASPLRASGIKAHLISFRRIDTAESYLGGVDLDRVAINDTRHAADIGDHGGLGMRLRDRGEQGQGHGHHQNGSHRVRPLADFRIIDRSR